jgi:small subunit ribosomal protein S1
MINENFAQLLEESLTTQHMRSGEIVMAEVIDIGADFVRVNAGLKSESYIPTEEFRSDTGIIEAQVGDRVPVIIEALADGNGTTVLSREKAKRQVAWEEMERAMQDGRTVTGIVLGRVKGGLTVLSSGIKAFLPGSLVDVRPVKDLSIFEGTEIECKVIKMDKKRNNIVVSRRAVMEAQLVQERESLLAHLQEGQVVKGVVKNITDYGAFIDLGGLDGLLHITDLAWQRVRHPSEVLNVGEEIEVRVLRFDRENQRVSLGLKQLGEDPWADIARRYPPGTRVFGRVTNVTDYGAFVEMEQGVEGLVHMSEMDWTNKNINPSKVVQPGDEVEVMVLEIDESRRRISLGIKQCLPNPWDEFAREYNKGDVIRGPIKSITDFGIFIGLPGGIDGLIHLSDLSWKEPGEEAVRKYQKGAEVEAMVLAIDVANQRISLGVKQLQEDPFLRYAESHEKGAMVKGKVIDVDPKGAVVEIADGVEGYIKVGDIAKERLEDARQALKEGDEIEAQIVQIDKKNRSIALSIRARETAAQSRMTKQLSHEQQAAAAGATNLGALLRAKLDERANDSHEDQ